MTGWAPGEWEKQQRRIAALIGEAYAREDPSSPLQMTVQADQSQS